MEYSKVTDDLYFNPRTHVGCDLGRRAADSRAASISIHAPTWGATQDKPCDTSHDRFQSTHPRGVRLIWYTKCFIAPSYFNPRTHVGCDAQREADARKSLISIHAPTWGATLVKRKKSVKPCISIHAPTWGATNFDKINQKICKFQSTHPRGVRPPFFNYFVNSLHFNPRTHVGCDLWVFHLQKTSIEFQSTHPRGVRLPISRDLICRMNFNPRTHVGCDPEQVNTEIPPKGFQSTHPRGVRRGGQCNRR